MTSEDDQTRLITDKTVAQPKSPAPERKKALEETRMAPEATRVKARKASANSTSMRASAVTISADLPDADAGLESRSKWEDGLSLNELEEKPKTNSTDFPSTLQFAENTDQKYRNARAVKTSDDLVPGVVVKQRFKLVKRLGRGGMGTIFLAADLRKEELQDRDSHIAIKFLNEELHDSMSAVIALQREAKKSQALSHPNIVIVYDFDRENTIFFFSMEYLKGESFDHYISRSANRMEKSPQLMRYVEFMARGLAYAHQEGFVHADFKPANVFLTEQGQIKVLDFGIAQAVRSNMAASHSDDSIFDPASLGAMTPNYASLEMLDHQRPVPSDDVYGLAVVAYELLSGGHPYQANGKRLTAKQAYEMNLEVKPIKGVSRRHMKAITKGLAFKRVDRFENAGTFIDAIKPKVKLRRSVLAFIAVMIFSVVLSWGFVVNKTEAVIGFSDLPPSMNELVETIKEADVIFARGDIDQSHKYYVQAWEAGVDLVKSDSRDQYKLKVIIDRRINKVTRHFISKINAKSSDQYTLIQLELTLNFLQKDDLGSIDEEIGRALERIQVKLDGE